MSAMKTVGCAIATLFCCLSAPAGAQAFTQPEGKGRVIASFIYSSSDKAFNDNSRAVDISDYEKAELYLLTEYGATDDLTLLFTPSFRSVSVKDDSGINGSDSSGLGYTDIGARYRIAHTDRFVLSLQGLIRIPGEKRRDVLAQIGQTDAEYDLRAQGGLTFGQGSFAILEAAYRLRGGDPADDFHIDATLGIRATPRLLLLANSYNTISNGRGRGVFAANRYHNVYLSIAYDITPRVTLQLGGLGTVAGRNALRERGAFGGAWFRF